MSQFLLHLHLQRLLNYSTCYQISHAESLKEISSFQPNASFSFFFLLFFLSLSFSFFFIFLYLSFFFFFLLLFCFFFFSPLFLFLFPFFFFPFYGLKVQLTSGLSHGVVLFVAEMKEQILSCQEVR